MVQVAPAAVLLLEWGLNSTASGDVTMHSDSYALALLIYFID